MDLSKNAHEETSDNFKLKCIKKKWLSELIIFNTKKLHRGGGYYIQLFIRCPRCRYKRWCSQLLQYTSYSDFSPSLNFHLQLKNPPKQYASSAVKGPGSAVRAQFDVFPAYK